MTINQADKNKPIRQIFTGTVVSDKMKDTVVVDVKSFEKHSKYKKFFSKTRKFMAHNPGNTKKMGETAKIEACRPMSKRKAFKVIA